MSSIQIRLVQSQTYNPQPAPTDFKSLKSTPKKNKKTKPHFSYCHQSLYPADSPPMIQQQS